MIAIDTNVLLRLMVGDEADQARRAKAVVDDALRASSEVVISPIVLAEFVWTLRRSYKLSARDVAAHLERLLTVPSIRIVDRDVVVTAVADYRRGPADFSDYLIAAYAEREGALSVFSFDADAVKSGRFHAVP